MDKNKIFEEIKKANNWSEDTAMYELYVMNKKGIYGYKYIVAWVNCNGTWSGYAWDNYVVDNESIVREC